MGDRATIGDDRRPFVDKQDNTVGVLMHGLLLRYTHV